MPEFIGRPRLPEQLAAMRLQMEQQNPWAAAIASLGESLGKGLYNRGQNKIRQSLQDQVLQARSDQAAAAQAAMNERFDLGQRGAAIRAKIAKGFTLGPGSTQIPDEQRISILRDANNQQIGQFPLGPNEVQTQPIPGMDQMTTFIQGLGLHPRAGDAGVAFNAPAPKPVLPKAGEFRVGQFHVDSLKGWDDWSEKLGGIAKHTDFLTAMRDKNNAEYKAKLAKFKLGGGGKGAGGKQTREDIAMQHATSYADSQLWHESGMDESVFQDLVKTKRDKLIMEEYSRLLSHAVSTPQQLPSAASVFLGNAFGGYKLKAPVNPAPPAQAPTGPNYTASPDPRVELPQYDEEDEDLIDEEP